MTLTVRGLCVDYGPIAAVRSVDLDVAQGETVFVVGQNGAGKSTLLRAIANIVKRSSGTVTFNGRATAGLSADRVVGLGFTLVPEGREIFGTLTVDENLRLGAYLRRETATVERDVAMLLDEFPTLKKQLKTPAALLSGGQQQMLAIGRAIMTGAQMIALDEPALGLAPKIIDQIYEILFRLRVTRNLTLLIAEQSFARAARMRAKAVVLRGGRLALSGGAAELRDSGELERAYFGFAAE